MKLLGWKGFTVYLGVGAAILAISSTQTISNIALKYDAENVRPILELVG